MQTWSIQSELQAYKNVPPAPEAVVLLVHGFGEHAGRHAATMAAFARRGIAVYAYDHRGHGRSAGRRAFVERFEDLVDDTLMMRARVAALHPGLPFYLFGVSMGGVVAVRSAQSDSSGLAGVVLLAPALMLPGGGPLMRALAMLVARFAPATPVATLELDALSRDRTVVDAYASDALNYHGGVPARTAVELVAAGAAAVEAAPTWSLPTLIVHGDADRIAALAGSRRFAAAARAADVTLRIVPGGYHEPFTEPGGAALIDEVATWIVAREARKPPAPSDAPFVEPPHVYTWWEGLAFGAAINLLSRMLGTNTGRYEAIERPWFAPPGWMFPVVWGINNVFMIWGNIRVLNAPPSTDRTAYLRLWTITWMLYLSFGYAFFRRKSPVLGLLVTVNFLTLAVLSADRAKRIDRQLLVSYATLIPWLVLATAVAAAVALKNADPLFDGGDGPRSQT